MEKAKVDTKAQPTSPSEEMRPRDAGQEPSDAPVRSTKGIIQSPFNSLIEPLTNTSDLTPTNLFDIKEIRNQPFQYARNEEGKYFPKMNVRSFTALQPPNFYFIISGVGHW